VSPTHRLRRAARVACAFSLAACTAPFVASEPRWEPIVVYEGDAPFERVRAGDADPASPGLELVGVDQGGSVVIVRFDGERARSEVLHRQGGEMTGLAIADVDPSELGAEIYAGGVDSGESGGSVLQIVVTPAGPRVRRLWTGSAYVHAIEAVPPRAVGDPVKLLFTTYAGEVHLLTPSAGGAAWADRVLHREPASADPEATKLKDVAFLVDPSGNPPHEALVVAKTGRAVVVDLDHPETARLVLDEPGGLSRIAPDPDGGAYVTGYAGRVLHLVPEVGGFRADVLDHEGPASGLRGVVLGRFPVAGGTAPIAIFGYHALCRTLTPRHGAWDPTTIFRDSARGHTLEAVDLFPGDGADELVVAGHSKKITVLVSRR
jgi:hypothetical protein